MDTYQKTHLFFAAFNMSSCKNLDVCETFFLTKCLVKSKPEIFKQPRTLAGFTYSRLNARGVGRI